MKPKPLPAGRGQESVWQYPRPPIVQPAKVYLRVLFADTTLASTHDGLRTLETSHPPCYYIPRVDVQMQHLRPTARTSSCEWKGRANYFDVVVGERVAAYAAWTYPHPAAAFAPIANCVAFYPALMDACFVDDELATPQPGEFYGGWITSQIVGPFKGSPGSNKW